MSAGSPRYETYQASEDKRPRLVVVIYYPTASLYFTSHDDITGVPGTPILGVVHGLSAQSQRIVPDEGRSEIGSMRFSLVDPGGVVTAAFNAKLAAGYGLRGRRSRLFRGYEGLDFSEFRIRQTQEIVDVEVDRGVYSIECEDITRALRKKVFAPAITTLRAPIGPDDMVIPVYETSGHFPVEHGDSWSDAPNKTVGYVQIGDEKIRWISKTADTFIVDVGGRGALATRAKAHAVDATAATDQRTKVSEVVYLELPCLMMAYALMTGVLYGQTGTLPEHWHMGIENDLVVLDDFLSAGLDLWNPSDSTTGVKLRFIETSEIDAKTLLERDILFPSSCVPRVYPDGTIGVLRMASINDAAAVVATLSEREIVSHGPLRYDVSSVLNDIEIDWSYSEKQRQRTTKFVDKVSQRIHNDAPTKTYNFRGFYGGTHTELQVWQQLFQIRDRYSAPPFRITTVLAASAPELEVGQVARVSLPQLLDLAKGGALNRAMEVQSTSFDQITGQDTIEWFGSTARASTIPPKILTTFPLPDAFYSSEGTLLSSVAGITIVGNVLTAAPATPIDGGSDMNAAAAIFYWLGPLTIQNGVELKIRGNFQLRVMGFLTLNGKINGVGQGLAGVADDGAVSPYLLGNAGFIGSSRGRDGIRVTEMGGNPQMESQPTPTTEGRFASFPPLSLRVVGSTLIGLPSDLRGTGGGPGGKVVYQSSLRANGGAGAAGGAGLIIISRGMGLGASAQIDLSGNDTTSPSSHLEQGKNFFPGSGGAGGPGAMFIGIDAGASVSVPDITGKFFAVTGTVGAPFLAAEFPVFYLPSRTHQRRSRDEQPYAGYEGPELLTDLDFSNAAHRIQYIPPESTPRDDVEEPPPPPLTLGATSGPGYILVTVTPANVPNSVVVLYASVNPNFADAVEVQEIRGSQFYFQLLAEETRYLFVTTRQELDANTIVESDPLPGTTSTVVATAGASSDVNLPEEADFLETFEGQDVDLRYDSIEGTGIETYPLGAGAYGGRTYRVTGGQRWRAFKRNIPFDPSGFYRVTAVCALIAPPTNATADRVWFGVVCVAADGVTLLNVTGANDHGSQHYVAAAGADLGSVPLGTFVSFTGYFKGHGTAILTPAPDPDAPSPLYPGTAYFRPMMIVNYANGDGTTDVDYLRVEKWVNSRWVDILGDGKADDRATMVSSGNLITNGSGEFGDNRNFTAAGMEYVASGGADNGGPYLRLPPRVGAVLITDQSIPVLASDHEYEFRGALRSPDTGNIAYLGLACFDADGHNISHGRSHCNGPNAFLAADVAAGATTFDVYSHSGDFSLISGLKCLVWNINTYASDPTFYNKLEDYVLVGSGTITKTDLGGGKWRYTLPGGAVVPKSYPADTLLACNLEGGSFLYPLFDGVTLTSSWDRRTARFRGMNTAYESTDQNSYTFGGQKYFTFRRGTVRVFPMLLHNFGGTTPRETHVDELQLLSYGDQFKKYLFPNLDPYYGAFAAPDPDFVFAEKFMVRVGVDAAWTLSKTGGLVAGIATVDSAGQFVTDLWMETPDKEDMLDRIPTRRVRTMKGRSVTVLCRWRRRSTWTTNPGGDSTFLNLQVLTYNAGRTGSTIHGQTSLASINSRTVDAWQEESLTVTLGATINDYYLVGRINFTSSGAILMASGAIEIDYFDVR